MSCVNIWMLDHYAGLPATIPATRTYDLARELVAMGHRSTIFACSFNHYSFKEEQLRPGQLFRVVESDRVRVVWIRGIPYKHNDLWRFLNMGVYAVLAFTVGLWLGPRPDIVIGATIHPLAPVSAHLLSRLRRSRFWLDIVDIWPESLVDLGHLRASGITAKAIAAIERSSLCKAELVMSSLPNIAGYVRDMGFGGKLTAWIPIGIHRDRASLIGQADQHLRDGTFTVAYAGGFAPAHALDTILDAAAAVQASGRSHIRFVLIGDGPEMPRVIARIVELGLTNVRLTGFVPKDQVYARLSEADAFLCTGRSLPVYRYGVSYNKIFDYLLVGRPIVYAMSSWNDPVADAGAGLSVPAEDAKALAEAVVQLSGMEPELLQEMGLRGRQYVLSEFDYVAIARRLAALF